MRLSSIRIIPFIIVVSACSSAINEGDFFCFDVQYVDDLAISGTIQAERVSPVSFGDLISFQIIDSLLIYRRGERPYDSFLFVDNLFTGERYGEFCRFGRGPDELLSASVNFEINDGCVSLFDFINSRYYEVDIMKSLVKGSTVYRKNLKIEQIPGKSMLFVHPIPQFNHVLLFDSASSVWEPRLEHEPCFSIFNLTTGEYIDDYQLFRNVPLRKKGQINILPQAVIAFHDSMNTKRDKLCFVQNRLPQINILDIGTGKARGIRIKGLPRFSSKTLFNHFMSVDSDDNYIYALYFGETAGKEHTTPSFLYVFDWNGIPVFKYLLDRPYLQCRVSGHKLYLHCSNEWEATLYSIDLDYIHQVNN